MKVALFALVLVLARPAFGREVEGVTFPESVDALVLNGAGLRRERAYGINWRVYVAGLYLPKKSSDAQALIETREPKRLELVFLRRVSKDRLVKGFETGFKSNCGDDCAAFEDNAKRFADLMRDVHAKDRIVIRFTDEDKVELEVQTDETSRGEFTGAPMRKNVLATFLGPHAASPELRDALLGLGDAAKVASK